MAQCQFKVTGRTLCSATADKEDASLAVGPGTGGTW